jgi:hypothetical protein
VRDRAGVADKPVSSGSVPVPPPWAAAEPVGGDAFRASIEAFGEMVARTGTKLLPTAMNASSSVYCA